MSNLGSTLAALNASLNFGSAVCIASGLLNIWRQRWRAHMWSMIAAAGLSALFLVSYVTRYSLFGSTPFKGTEWIRPVYYALLWSHISLSVVELPLIIVTLYRAYRGYGSGDYVGHRRMARITYPIWLYVSVTGVLVYLFLYRIYP